MAGRYSARLAASSAARTTTCAHQGVPLGFSEPAIGVDRDADERAGEGRGDAFGSLDLLRFIAAPQQRSQFAPRVTCANIWRLAARIPFAARLPLTFLDRPNGRTHVKAVFRMTFLLSI